MIQTWLADVTELLNEEKYLFYYKKVPDFRKEKADKLRFQADKALSIGAWILWEKMRVYYGLKENAPFNLSHSGHMVMCSAEDTGDVTVKVGCDVERVQKVNLKIAKRFFNKNEYQMILKDENMFYRFWVLKESFMKATRLGMKLGMDTFEIGMEDDKPILKSKPDDIEGTFYFKEYECKKPNYRMAVCSSNKNFEERIQMIDL